VGRHLLSEKRAARGWLQTKGGQKHSGQVLKRTSQGTGTANDGHQDNGVLKKKGNGSLIGSQTYPGGPGAKNFYGKKKTWNPPTAKGRGWRRSNGGAQKKKKKQWWGRPRRKEFVKKGRGDEEEPRRPKVKPTI